MIQSREATLKAYTHKRSRLTRAFKCREAHAANTSVQQLRRGSRSYKLSSLWMRICICNRALRVDGEDRKMRAEQHAQ